MWSDKLTRVLITSKHLLVSRLVRSDHQPMSGVNLKCTQSNRAALIDWIAVRLRKGKELLPFSPDRRRRYWTPVAVWLTLAVGFAIVATTGPTNPGGRPEWPLRTNTVGHVFCCSVILVFVSIEEKKIQATRSRRLHFPPVCRLVWGSSSAKRTLIRWKNAFRCMATTTSTTSINNATRQYGVHFTSAPTYFTTETTTTTMTIVWLRLSVVIVGRLSRSGSWRPPSGCSIKRHYHP